MKFTYIPVGGRCAKFPKEPKLKKFVLGIMETFTSSSDKMESLSREEQVEAQAKKDLFNLLPPHTKKALLLQASGV